MCQSVSSKTFRSVRLRADAAVVVAAAIHVLSLLSARVLGKVAAAAAAVAAGAAAALPH